MEKQTLKTGVRVVATTDAKLGVVNCGGKGYDDCRACNMAGRAGTLWTVDEKAGKAEVVFDASCKHGHNLLLIDINKIDFLTYKIVFSFHHVTGSDNKCASVGCTEEAGFRIYNMINGKDFVLCETHAIEWFNAQYRQLADVADQLKKQYNQIKYSVPYEVPKKG